MSGRWIAAMKGGCAEAEAWACRGLPRANCAASSRSRVRAIQVAISSLCGVREGTWSDWAESGWIWLMFSSWPARAS